MVIKSLTDETDLCFSRYRYSSQLNRGKPNLPIYGSSAGQNFSDWISTWTLELVSKVDVSKTIISKVQ